MRDCCRGNSARASTDRTIRSNLGGVLLCEFSAVLLMLSRHSPVREQEDKHDCTCSGHPVPCAGTCRTCVGGVAIVWHHQWPVPHLPCDLRLLVLKDVVPCQGPGSCRHLCTRAEGLWMVDPERRAMVAGGKGGSRAGAGVVGSLADPYAHCTGLSGAPSRYRCRPIPRGWSHSDRLGLGRSGQVR